MRRVLVAVAALTTLLVASSASAQEIQITGPLVGASTLACHPPRRHGRAAFAASTAFSLDDSGGTTVLAGGSTHWFTSERLGFGMFGAHHVGPTDRVQWLLAPEVTFVLGVGRIDFDTPFDWRIAVGPVIAKTPLERSVVGDISAATSLTVLKPQSGLSLAVDWRFFGGNVPAHAFLGLSLGIGIRIPRASGCREVRDEATR
jgi:hypothetical protein